MIELHSFVGALLLILAVVGVEALLFVGWLAVRDLRRRFQRRGAVRP